MSNIKAKKTNKLTQNKLDVSNVDDSNTNSIENSLNNGNKLLMLKDMDNESINSNKQSIISESMYNTDDDDNEYKQVNPTKKKINNKYNLGSTSALPINEIIKKHPIKTHNYNYSQSQTFEPKSTSVNYDWNDMFNIISDEFSSYYTGQSYHTNTHTNSNIMFNSLKGNSININKNNKNNINNNINNNSSYNNDNNIDNNNADNNININDNDSIDDDGFDINIWKCPTCGENNDESNKFCPKCGCKNDLLMGSIFDENNNDNNDNREEKKIELNDINNNGIKIPLKLINIVGTTKFEPQERKQIGWILKNTGNFNKFKCNLDCLNKNKIVGLKVINDETGYEFSLDNNEEIYVLFELIAPCLPGKYTIFFSLTNEFNKKVADILELAIDVKPKFNKKKESKIENIVKMGFDDRKKIEYALNKHEWNVEEAVNELIN